MSQDTSKIKEEIIYRLKINGPSLPVHIAKWISSSILFTSAFLSELTSEKRLKMSHMRIGSSPLYFTEGQESMLEKFSQHLKSKEAEAFGLLKEKKFLKDSEQEPAIRVALRQIKDFAIPFKKEEYLLFRFFTVPEAEFIEIQKPTVTITALPVEMMKKNAEAVIENEALILEGNKEPKEPVQVIPAGKPKKREKEPKKIKLKPKQKATRKTSKEKKYDEKFLEKVKEFLSRNSIEIVNIEGLKKDELLLRIKVNGNEQLLVAYKKKKISENEIIKTAKKASEMNLRYSILSMGELPKKISGLIKALQNINDIKKVE